MVIRIVVIKGVERRKYESCVDPNLLLSNI